MPGTQRAGRSPHKRFRIQTRRPKTPSLQGPHHSMVPHLTAIKDPTKRGRRGRTKKTY